MGQKHQSPAKRLASIGTTVQAVISRIAATWWRATDADKEAGATWYFEAEGIIDRLAAQSGNPRETIAAVIAHLSPRTTWSRNVTGAVSLVLTGQAPGCMQANVDRALKALNSLDPLGTLNGPKTRRFALNMLGDRESVTIDAWTARVALGHDDAERQVGRQGIYEALEHCFRLAARRIGVDPVTLQATVWIVARNGRAG